MSFHFEKVPKSPVLEDEAAVTSEPFWPQLRVSKEMHQEPRLVDQLYCSNQPVPLAFVVISNELATLKKSSNQMQHEP